MIFMQRVYVEFYILVVIYVREISMQLGRRQVKLVRWERSFELNIDGCIDGCIMSERFLNEVDYIEF